MTKPQVRIDNFLPKLGQRAVRQEIHQGLTSKNKMISSKYFYDETGSKLFEKITTLSEYYPTKTEKGLIKQLATQLNAFFDFKEIIEIGSGDASKISILLNELPRDQALRYLPVDFSQSAIEESITNLNDRYPTIEIHGMVADFTSQLNLLPKGGKRLICFFGSTIGNFNREQAEQLLNHISQAMQPEDRLILGMDRVKNNQVLENAYNDDQGLTAKFNRNILRVVNKLTGTNFNLDDFEHLAYYNVQDSRIEMHLKALKAMEITSPYWEATIKIRSGETIHTENSYKFSDDHIDRLAHSSGLSIDQVLTDEKQWFSLVQFKKPAKVTYATN